MKAMRDKVKNLYISYYHIDTYFKDQLRKIIGDNFNIKSSPQEYYVKNDIKKYYERLNNENLDDDIFIVLLGSDTYKSKNVDWDIEYGLKHNSTIVGLCLPTNDDYRKRECNIKHIPTQLAYNIYSGYASYFDWTDSFEDLKNIISITSNQKVNKHAIIY